MVYLSVIAFLLLLAMAAIAIFNNMVEKGIDLKERMEALSTPVGWIGVFLFVMGIIALFNVIINLGSASGDIIALACILTMIVGMIALGGLAGVAVVKPFVKSEEAKAKIDSIISKVAPYRAIISYAVLIAFAVLMLKVAGLAAMFLAR